MREIFQYTHPNISASEYAKRNLRNSDVDRALANSNGYDLKEWFYNREDSCTIRFLINVHWTDPIQHIIGTSELTVNEKRKFYLNETPIHVKSTIRTTVSYITAKISHLIEDRPNGCIEEISIEVNYSGGTFKDQIEQNFFDAILPLICIGKQNADTPKALVVSPRKFQAYHFIHEQLEQLKASSQYYSDVVEQSRLKRTQLTLPSADQIARITEIVDPSNFSIQTELNQLTEEAERTMKIVGEIKRARQQTENSSSLPIFVLASCAAVAFLVVSRTNGNHDVRK
ncbi:hypothetical protein TRFO_42549 [Tritrichomonas foetus]|uniref:VASt domain-containing protein n=1 Tax=Tritrichomonas foetus TaxID=1144522 RepID=A0A1J4KVL7_9EUKA|nr:hypothetical protein TRFO_42549 [Tritrichomonas foetus]|eukprot:OHT15353.1 hypothetical protein TRFO_42549 [Tritrichomonas foetus]